MFSNKSENILKSVTKKIFLISKKMCENFLDFGFSNVNILKILKCPTQ